MLLDAQNWITELDLAEAFQPHHGLRVWLVYLDQPDPVSPELRHLLAADELQRAGRFLVESARRRFVISRAAVRMVLGDSVGADPRAIRLAYTEKGKPYLASNPGAASLRFNLSHSGDLALIATATDREVGVDIEMTQERPEAHEAASTFLALAEQLLLDQLTPTERSRVFYRIWTRKEAILKAAGPGITAGLHAPDVSRAAAGTGSTLVDPIEHAGRRWLVYGFQPTPNAEGAVAVEADTL